MCPDNRCSIHEHLRDKGFHGCVSYECFGAGQHVSQEIFKSNDELIRKEYIQSNKKSKIRKDFIGANLEGANLLGMNLRGTLLIASNLRGADLRKVDFIGADLRDDDLSGANFTGCIFLTQAQVNSAKGNKDTRLPRYLKVPAH